MKLIPVDNIGKDGTSYKTVGENIRNTKTSSGFVNPNEEEFENMFKNRDLFMTPTFPYNGEWWIGCVYKDSISGEICFGNTTQPGVFNKLVGETILTDSNNVEHTAFLLPLNIFFIFPMNRVSNAVEANVFDVTPTISTIDTNLVLLYPGKLGETYFKSAFAGYLAFNYYAVELN